MVDKCAPLFLVSRKKKYIYLAVAVIVVAVVWGSLALYEKTTRAYPGAEDVWLRIPKGSTEESIRDSLRYNLGATYGETVFEMWRLAKGTPLKAVGAYKIQHGDKALDIARRLKRGAQTPIKLTFNNVRLFNDIASRIASHFDFDAEDFMAAADSLLPSYGIDSRNYIGAFLPDTYEFYWNSNPAKVIERLYAYHESFWNDERKSKASAIGLTPEQVTVLASIVDEETAVSNEKPVIARLYLNRLGKGMKLQADPTVKFAVCDFSLRRILNKHLTTESPYNTYLHIGLPPGPIRMPEKSTIDAVLNAPKNNYLYMCAKEDFSGTHNFATTLEQHNANATRYRQALDNRKIK